MINVEKEYERIQNEFLKMDRLRVRAKDFVHENEDDYEKNFELKLSDVSLILSNSDLHGENVFYNNQELIPFITSDNFEKSIEELKNFKIECEKHIQILMKKFLELSFKCSIENNKSKILKEITYFNNLDLKTPLYKDIKLDYDTQIDFDNFCFTLENDLYVYSIRRGRVSLFETLDFKSSDKLNTLFSKELKSATAKFDDKTNEEKIDFLNKKLDLAKKKYFSKYILYLDYFTPQFNKETEIALLKRFFGEDFPVIKDRKKMLLKDIE